MWPSRMVWPKVGEQVVFFDDSSGHEHFVMLYTCENKTIPILKKYEVFTIKSISLGTGVTFATFEEIHGTHDLSDFLQMNDIWLRKHKLETLNDRVRKGSQRIRKV